MAATMENNCFDLGTAFAIILLSFKGATSRYFKPFLRCKKLLSNQE